MPTFLTIESSTYKAGSFLFGGAYHDMSALYHQGNEKKYRMNLDEAVLRARYLPTLRMCCCRTSAIASACSVFSRAIVVKLLISNRMLEERSSSARR